MRSLGQPRLFCCRMGSWHARCLSIPPSLICGARVFAFQPCYTLTSHCWCVKHLPVLGLANSEQRKERRQAAAHRSQHCSVGYTQPPAAPHKVFTQPLSYIFGRRMGPGWCWLWESTHNTSVVQTFPTCPAFSEKVRGIFCNLELSLAISLIYSPPAVSMLQTHLSCFPPFLNNISY